MYGGEEKRGAYRVLVGKSGGDKLLRRLRNSWEEYIIMDFYEIAWDDVDWISLAEDRNKWRAFVSTI
jgi:hypothetical protein